MIAMLIEDMLVGLHCEVIQTAARIDSAVAAAETGLFDFAMLDVNLGGVLSYPVADVLKARGIPFAFVTGYGAGALGGAYVGAPTLQKPFVRGDLETVISRVLPPKTV